MNTKIILLKYAVLEARTIFFIENTYFRALKKIVLIHRTLLAKNVIFLEIALVFSENKKNIQKWEKIIKHGSDLIENQYTGRNYLILL